MPTQAGTIAIISEWRLDEGQFLAGTFFSFEDFYMRPDKLVIQCIMDYAKEKNKQLVIIPTMPNSNDLIIQEKAYFRELMGREPKFLRPPGPYPGYLAVDSVEILVALESTLVYESIARGKKAAIFPIRGAMIGVADRNFGWPADYPDEGPFWTNKPDSDIFIRILDYLFEVSDEQWKKDVEATNFSSIMEYDPRNTIFQSILEKELGPPPTLVN